jgi:hypothetical protein
VILYPDLAEEAPPASRHAVHDARLAEVMDGLATLSGARLPDAIDSREPFQTRRLELVEAARALALSSEEIARVAPSLELDEPERDDFLFLAEVLRRRAQTLAGEAPFASIGELQERVREIRGTCDHCHGRYRTPRSGAALRLRAAPARG